MLEEGRPAEITALLRDLESGQTGAGARLLELVYEELRGIARGRLAKLGPAQSIRSTELVHEAWLRLVARGAPAFGSRAHFFGAAANAMRNHMVEAARRRASRVRAASGEVAACEDLGIDPGVPLGDVLAVHEALTELERTHPRQARIVTLRFFGGLALPEAAEVVGASLATVERDWRFARAWLQRELDGSEG